MKKTISRLALALLLLPACQTVLAQGIVFNTGTWADMLQKAKKMDRLVFVDVYTSWCGPCKKMATQTFTQKEVGDFYNAHFVCYKIDAEKGEGVALAKKHQVNAYPTCLFVTADGQLAYRFMGAKDVKEVLAEGNKALKYAKIVPQMQSLSAQYKAGKRDKTFLKEYVNLILDCGEKPGQALTDYLKTLTDEELFAKENLNKFDKVTVYDKDLFNRMAAAYITTPDTVKKNLERPIMKAIGGCLSPLMDGKKADIPTYESLLSVKENMGIKSSIVQVYLGGGVAYLPNDELRIIFYETADVEKYKLIVPKYMNENVDLNEADSISHALQTRREGIVHQMDSLKALGDTSALKSVRAKWNFGKVLLSLSFQNEMDFIASTALKYWQMSDKGEAVSKQCKSWAEFAYKMYDRAPVVEDYARMLIALGDKDNAHKTLQKAVESIKNDPSGEVNENDLKQADELLKQLP
jgi:thiol-disulfide isomerase/thioredoxin